MSQFTSWLSTRRARTRLMAVVIGFAVMVAPGALAPSPAQADLSVDDSNCRYSATPVETADRILQGYYTMKPWPERKLSTNLT